MDKVKAGLRGLTAEEKLVKGRVVLQQMQGNPDFPDPVPSMADLKQACDRLEAANLAALDRDLPFLHHLEQRGLRLGRRAVDFVGQQQIGEHRPAPRGELA